MCDPVTARRALAARAALETTRSDVEAPVDAAILSATRVRITPEIMRAAANVSSIVLTEAALAAAFREAGFEVES